MLEFGVSGLLYESNLVMYDRLTESLWSQSLGRSVAGNLAGTELEILPASFLTVGQLRESEPDALVLSEETGYERDYRQNPYAGYDESEQLIAPVTRQDDLYPTKEIMYVFRLDDVPVAVPYDSIPDGRTETELRGHSIAIEKEPGTEQAFIDGELVPGYLEMWFSVVAQHDEVEVWEPAP